MHSLRRFFNIYRLAVVAAALVSCAAADEAGPVFVKVYAGPALNTARDFDRVVKQNLKKKAVIPDETRVDCEAGQRYGLGVIVTAPGRQTFSFQTTAIWRDADVDRPPRRSTREHTLRKNQFGTRRFFFTIREGSVDHDMTFIAHVGNQVYLRHKFMIRGCTARGQAAGQANVQDNDGDR